MTDESDPEVESALALLLQRSALTPGTADRAAMASALKRTDEHRDQLYAVPAARYAEPGLIFTARAVS